MPHASPHDAQKASRPASLFAFGVFHLLNGDTLRRKLRAGGLLLGMFLISIPMAFAMFDTCWLRWAIALLKERENEVEFPRNRLYASQIGGSRAFLFGMPNIDNLLLALSIVYMSVAGRRVDEETLSCTRPSANTHFCLRLLWELAFSLHYLFFHVCTVMSASAIMITSDDAVDIVLNMLSVVFLFDLDKVLYVFSLSDEDREQWEKC